MTGPALGGSAAGSTPAGRQAGRQAMAQAPPADPAALLAQVSREGEPCRMASSSLHTRKARTVERGMLVLVGGGVIGWRDPS